MKRTHASCEQADARGIQSKRHTHLKRRKNRTERRRAKLDPEAQPGYGKYRGYET